MCILVFTIMFYAGGGIGLSGKFASARDPGRRLLYVIIYFFYLIPLFVPEFQTQTFVSKRRIFRNVFLCFEFLSSKEYYSTLKDRQGF